MEIRVMGELEKGLNTRTLEPLTEAPTIRVRLENGVMAKRTPFWSDLLVISFILWPAILQ